MHLYDYSDAIQILYFIFPFLILALVFEFVQSLKINWLFGKIT